MSRRTKVYGRQGKILYEGPGACTLIPWYFRILIATAFQLRKKAPIAGKGVITTASANTCITRYAHIGITTHFNPPLNMREQFDPAGRDHPFSECFWGFAANVARFAVETPRIEEERTAAAHP